MAKLKTAIEFETAFRSYRATEVLGQGGAGTVYAASDDDGIAVAVKVLTSPTTEKRKRFKNETAFLQRNRHEALVPVLDSGLKTGGPVSGPFYVMPRYDGSLRELLQGGISPEDGLDHFKQVLDGAEAAHLTGAVHRDLKPENVLFRGKPARLAIADFGIARFTEDQLATAVETLHGSRLANFEYAAPEQRRKGNAVGIPADIYALGLILHEVFTRAVPHGTAYKRIGDSLPAFAFIDPVVDQMLRSDPSERPQSVAAVRRLLALGRDEFLTAQKLHALTREVVPEGEVDHPLVVAPPRLVGADWDRGTLKLTLDKPVTRDWVTALIESNAGSYFMGHHPASARFDGPDIYIANVSEHEAQQHVDMFKPWIVAASDSLRRTIEGETLRQRRELERRNAEEREAIAARQRVVKKLSI